MQSEHWAHGLPMSAYYALMHNRVDISSRQDLHALAQSGELIQVAKGTINSGGKRLRDISQWLGLPDPIETEKFTRRCIQCMEKHGYDVKNKESR